MLISVGEETSATFRCVAALPSNLPAWSWVVCASGSGGRAGTAVAAFPGICKWASPKCNTETVFLVGSFRLDRWVLLWSHASIRTDGVKSVIMHGKELRCLYLMSSHHQSRWTSRSCLLSFLLVLPTLWAVFSKCFVGGVLWGATGVTGLWPCLCLGTETQQSAKIHLQR